MKNISSVRMDFQKIVLHKQKNFSNKIAKSSHIKHAKHTKFPSSRSHSFIEFDEPLFYYLSAFGINNRKKLFLEPKLTYVHANLLLKYLSRR